MELITLFRREIIKQIILTFVPDLNSVASSVPILGSKSIGLESRFERTCRFKNGGCEKTAKKYVFNNEEKKCPKNFPQGAYYILVNIKRNKVT